MEVGGCGGFGWRYSGRRPAAEAGTRGAVAGTVLDSPVLADRPTGHVRAYKGVGAAYGPMSANEPTACQVAMEAAMEKVIEVCEGEDGREQAMRRTGRMLGMDGEPDQDCDACLEEGLDTDTCESFSGIRQWVLCRVFNSPPGSDEQPFLDKHDGNFEAAITESWDVAKAECDRDDI